VRHVEAYSRLAGVYDEIVVDPCHGRWSSFLHELWSTDPDGVRSVLDLCCGTGLLAGELIDRGSSTPRSAPSTASTTSLRASCD
jgi:predicted TPR repeat methyltransferase